MVKRVGKIILQAGFRQHRYNMIPNDVFFLKYDFI